MNLDFQERKIRVKMEFVTIRGLHENSSNLGSQKGVLPSGILGKSHEMCPDPPVTDLEEVSSEILLI